jgi:predicted RNA-binding Zn-ribbon protein involved in translation (DUF1610 family)/lipoprotein signal peptidase
MGNAPHARFVGRALTLCAILKVKIITQTMAVTNSDTQNLVAICPLCETVVLAGQHVRWFTCPTCRTVYCCDCQSWQEGGQKYCLECGLNLCSPPPVIHASVKRSAWLSVGLVALLAFVYVWSAWYVLGGIYLALGAYFGAYLLRFQSRTRLTWAARRETLTLLRQAVILFCLAYFLIRLGQRDGLVVIGLGALIATGLGLVVADRLDPQVVDELRSQRATWKAVLAMRALDALLLRFP